MKGVDISHYQKGLSIKQIKDAGNEFAIIKLTEGNFLIDSAAFGFYHEAFTLGFPVGCYCYSHATTAEEARAEAAFLLKTLNGFPMPCGVFLDVEAPEMLALSGKGLKIICDAFCEAVRKAGYIPGLYGSELNLWAKIDADALEEDVIVWVAHYGKQPDVAYDLWQSSDSGSVPGYSGKVDTDEVRSARFETLVDTGGCDYQYHHQLTTSAPDKPPDACPIDGPCEMPSIAGALDLLADYLKTAEFAAGFKKYIEEALKK